MSFRTLTLVALSLTALVITLGALTRLLDAGLGCPDWPTCYGQLIPPASNEATAPHSLDSGKAWMEMIHRYAAGLLGLLILFLAIKAERSSAVSSRCRWLSRSLLALVILQALFGMWTVTLKLQPQVVTIHLLGGMLLLALLWSLWRAHNPLRKQQLAPKFKRGAQLVLLLLTVQLALGGWTSSQYAGLACPDFPTCQGQWLPDLKFDEAFRISEFTDANHEGGLLSLEARVTIQVTHRIVALLLSFSIVLLSIALWRYRDLRLSISLLLSATVIQVSLGIANAVLLLPLPLALLHNTGAALLLLCLLDLTLRLRLRDSVVIARKHASATMLSG